MTTQDIINVKPTTEVPRSEPTRSGFFYRPAVDILERPDELVILADMPGVGADQLDIHFEGGELTIHGQAAPRQPDDTHYLTQEYGVGDFYRVFQVSERVNPEAISAELHDGVLTLHLPKAESAKPRKISVQAR